MKTKASSPPQQARRARKEGTQARILEVARLHFERDGFDAANIRAIAAEAGVASGTVLLHFTDKLGLLHAALHDDLEEAIERCLSAPKNQRRLLDRLCAISRPFYAYYAARPALSKTLLRESLLAKPPWRERFAEQVARVYAHVVAVVDEARASGEIARSIHADLCATAFLSFYYFALIVWIQGGVEAPLSIFKKLMAQHLSGAAVRSVEEVS